MRISATAILAGWMLVAASGVVIAQGVGARSAAGIPRYQPRTPTLSPYLNLLRPQGAFPNYYALVRPYQRQQAFNQQSVAFQQRQNQAIQTLERDFAQPEVLATGTFGWFLEEGARPPYQNTGHFYEYLQPQAQAAARR